MFLRPPDRDLVLDRRALIFAKFARFGRFSKNRKSRNRQTMQTIKYYFADGTTSEIEVSDEFYTLYAELLQQEKRNHWKETRRHISLNYLTDNGIDFESPAADPLSVLLQSEDEKQVHKAMAALSDKQRELLEKVFFKGMTLTAVAKEKGVSQPAITQQLATVLKKLKKFFGKTL